MLTEHEYPKMIDLRSAKLDIIIADMENDPGVRIQYSAKKSGIANSWKRWIGEKTGMAKLKTVEKKIEFEKQFTEWVEAKKKREQEYGHILPKYKELYDQLQVYNFVNRYSNEILGRSGIEAVSFAGNFMQLVNMVNDGGGEDQVKRVLDMSSRRASAYFKNYNQPTDRKLFVALMGLYGENLEKEWWAPAYSEVYMDCEGDFASIVDKIYSNSIFTDADRFGKFINDFNSESVKIIQKDALFALAASANTFIIEKVRPSYSALSAEIAIINRLYMKAQMEFAGDKVLWADANRTLRVAYGNIDGYNARDAVYHTHYTTLKGIMEKDNPEIYDYNVPERLRVLYKTKDYGRYAQDGEIPVCFIANNHTTGGNSGSPVINGEGHLIGINFDRAWEGVSSDLMFNPEQSRNISIDIRYALFIIDKFAGAGYLLDEMTLIE
jgi:hypothetical protein